MRDVRSRQIDLLRAIDLAHRIGPAQTARQLVQVYDGGALPTTTPKVYLTRPVTLDAADTEGASFSAATDSTQTIPVVVIGSQAPAAGELLVAHALGGRWLAERGKGGATDSYPCSPCAIPKKNLTLSWTNVLIGDGSTALVYNGTSAWNSACSNELLYSLVCVGGAIKFCTTYFLSGFCPTGQSQQCCYPGFDPFSFALLSYQCSPFRMVFQATGAGCPVLWSSGYDTFTITDP